METVRRFQPFGLEYLYARKRYQVLNTVALNHLEYDYIFLLFYFFHTLQDY